MHLSMVSPIPPPWLISLVGYIPILLPHGWGIVFQVTAFMQLDIKEL